MLALFLKPLMALGFALGAVALSALWYSGQGWVAVVIVLVIIMIGSFTQWLAKRKLPNDPVGAVRLFNARPFLIGAITAAAAALAFIVGIELAVEGASESDPIEVKQTKDAFKEIAQTLAAAIGAYITALTVQAADVDAAVGKYVSDQFLRVYKVSDTHDDQQIPNAISATPGLSDQAEAVKEFYRRLELEPRKGAGNTIEFQPDSYGAYALYETSMFGLTDWLGDNRIKRAEKIQMSLNKMSEKTTSLNTNHTAGH